MRTLELLAPARDLETGREAILHGADAVYIGAPAFGARAGATNSVEDIAALCTFAHRYRVRVYVTMNTIVYDSELENARQLVWQLYDSGVDALIVQDMAYLEMELPPIQLHASTQCDIRTPQKARWLAEAGFSQLVLPREFSDAEIAAVAQATDVPLEVFVHGALCVSYSGDCQAGFAATGRSANRGTCPQMCRLPYDLEDERGNVLVGGRHFLSMCDLCRLDDLAGLIEAGASSFKIEGRLKDKDYVKNVVSAYSEALDKIVAESGGKYLRSSVGRVVRTFVPDVSRSFNRGFTTTFRRRGVASLDSPKWTGQPVGKVKSIDSRGVITADLTATLSNGDGLGYIDPVTRQFRGFRLNRVEDTRLFARTPQKIPSGTVLYRNRDKAWDDIMATPTATRTIGVDMALQYSGDTVTLTATDGRGCTAVASAPYDMQPARSAQEEMRRKTLGKLGGTIYHLDGYTEQGLDKAFVPASVLASLKKEVVESLDAECVRTYNRPVRSAQTLGPHTFDGMELTYHDNIANALAERFYNGHGAGTGARALEVSGDVKPGTQVMATRYCLRRELGACLRTPDGKNLPERLYLRSPGQSWRYLLAWDCDKCLQKVILEK